MDLKNPFYYLPIRYYKFASVLRFGIGGIILHICGNKLQS